MLREQWDSHGLRFPARLLQPLPQLFFGQESPPGEEYGLALPLLCPFPRSPCLGALFPHLFLSACLLPLSLRDSTHDTPATASQTPQSGPAHH